MVATTLRLSAMPVLLTGLLLLPARRNRRDRYKTALDSGIVTAGLLAVWYFLAGPAMQHSGQRSSRITLLPVAVGSAWYP